MLSYTSYIVEGAYITNWKDRELAHMWSLEKIKASVMYWESKSPSKPVCTHHFAGWGPSIWYLTLVVIEPDSYGCEWEFFSLTVVTFVSLKGYQVVDTNSSKGSQFNNLEHEGKIKSHILEWVLVIVRSGCHWCNILFWLCWTRGAQKKTFLIHLPS